MSAPTSPIAQCMAQIGPTTADKGAARAERRTLPRPAQVGRVAPRAPSVVLPALVLLLAALTTLNVIAAVPVSVAPRLSASGVGNSFLPRFSPDERFVGFLSHANNLVTNDDLGPSLDLFVRDLVTSNTILVSVSSNGFGGANRDIGAFVLSPNDLVAAFETAAANLAPGDNNETTDIYARDLAAGVTRLVSVTADGAGAGNGPSFNPLISADRRYVIFESLASNLVTNDFNGTNDVFLRDLQLGVTTLLSVNGEGTASADGRSHSPAISADGLKVAFVSTATNITSGVTNRAGEIYVRDVAAGTSLWVTDRGGALFYSPPYRAFQPALSADGRFVVFKTSRARVVRYDTSRPANSVVLAFPLTSPSLTTNFFVFQDNPRVIIPELSPQCDCPDVFNTSQPAFSPDGRFAVFTSSTNEGSMQTVLRADFETFRTNIAEMWGGLGGNYFLTSPVPVVAIVSTNYQYVNPPPPRSFAPSASSDARRILFVSDARDTLTYTETIFRPHLRDMATNTLFYVSTNSNGLAGRVTHDSLPALSADGALMLWESDDDQLVPDDLNRASDIFLRDLATGRTTLISARHPARPAITGPSSAAISPGSLSVDGRHVAFRQYDSGLRPMGSNAWMDAVLRDMLAGTNTLLSSGYVLTNSVPVPPTNQALPPKISSDGRHALIAAGNATSTYAVWRDLVGGTNVRFLNANPGLNYSLTADGRMAAHEARGPIFIPFTGLSDGNNATDIVLFAPERKAFPQLAVEHMAISTSFQSAGFSTANSHSTNPIISADGGWIAFQSAATDLTADADLSPPGFQQFATRILRGPTNTVAGATKLVSYSTVASSQPTGVSAEQPLAGGGSNAVFSGDARYLFFEAGTNRTVFRHDLFNDYVLTYSLLSNGVFLHTNRARLTNLVVCADCTGAAPDLTGRFVAHEMPVLSNATRQVWLRDLLTGSNELISVNLAGAGGGNGSSTGPLLSFDARFVVFTSQANNLTPNDINRAADVFVRDRLMGVTYCVSRNTTGTATGNGPSYGPVLSPDGRAVAFQSFASDLAPGDYNDARDVFLVSLAGPDTDSDGLDDEWEVAYFNDLARDGSGDFDGDGASDRDELRAGTDPTNTGSVLRVMQSTQAFFNVVNHLYYYTTTLFWPSAPNRIYRAQFKSAIDAPWVDLPGDVFATGATAQKQHGPNLFSQGYYRVVLLAP